MKSDWSMNAGKAYTIIIIACFLSVVPSFYVYELVNGWGLLVNGTLRLELDLGRIVLFLLSIAALSCLHELTHAVGYVYIGKVPWKNIRIGIMWRSLTPYVHCMVGVRADVYKIAGLLPVIYGIVPLLVGLIGDLKFFYILGVFMLMGSYGDLLMLWILRSIPSGTLVKDHPSKLGCEIVEEY
ncbi:DUF3267 domain-containing protein [Paenibacillus piri]|uniref:DUF3267 domain-containing protein n=1 Tax=Paenibacillus piri TaxID=2547395 RepID=A0A4R5KS33_9BACL|nr:DUF3267 domain-containing protein [Paenibacillus piri]TDF98581.1 DUF3267 domain-containing protein [Paenibacillus piri]